MVCTATTSSVVVVNPLPIPVIATTENSGTTANDGIFMQMRQQL